MTNLIQNVINSLSTKDGGFSARKLSALVIMLCVIAIHVKWISLGNFSQLEMVLTIDYAAIASMLGMTTYQAIKTAKLKSDDNNQEPPTP